uniref:Uncharacterized protein n=1 Tax=Candidatus Kentrum sp. FW TaxID=2126338 RepID=A0A450T3F3_9GAMM|nr:MAG: hypothetical protein BECKFW1821B_GA0114236_10615 [Candidatus Kentron sp. FW]
MNWLPLFFVMGLPPTIQVAYLVLCPIVALMGRNRRLGFWGFLFFSILFSPIMGLFVVIVSGKKEEKRTDA